MIYRRVCGLYNTSIGVNWRSSVHVSLYLQTIDALFILFYVFIMLQFLLYLKNSMEFMFAEFCLLFSYSVI